MAAQILRCGRLLGCNLCTAFILKVGLHQPGPKKAQIVRISQIAITKNKMLTPTNIEILKTLQA
jgi:hypothetical protein